MCVRVVEQNLTVLHGNLTSRLLGGRGEGTQFSHASVLETAAASAFVITATYVVSCCWLVDAKIGLLANNSSDSVSKRSGLRNISDLLQSEQRLYITELIQQYKHG